LAAVLAELNKGQPAGVAVVGTLFTTTATVLLIPLTMIGSTVLYYARRSDVDGYDSPFVVAS